MINFKTIIRIIGILLLLETVMFLVCSGVSFYYRESDMLDFWKAGGITAGVGLLLAALGKGGERQLTYWSALPGWHSLFSECYLSI